MTQEQQILQSWHSNAAAWITTIANEEIESRRLVTNAAVIEAIAACKPRSLLDVGCGEGWLCREAANAVKTLSTIVGLDAIPGLVVAASTHGIGNYHIKSYQDIIEGRYSTPVPFDVAIFNFSLFENEHVKQLLSAIHHLIAKEGKLIIQTLHPHTACGDQPYKDGWREGSWNGFSQQFKDPAPWYFRTLESWIALLNDSGYRLINIKEPVHPVTGKPASVIFTCQPAGH
jgi:2-polyprenyl-3-methyl-5-hydroxy-6-metoxy-1,4-benzoquinol methylase